MKNVMIILVLFLFACQKEVYFELPEPEEKIVIDGWIEQDKFPVVSITKNASFYAKIDSGVIRNYVVTTAKVTVSTDNDSEILTLFNNKDYFPPRIYKGTEIKGDTGKVYELTVEHAGKIYHSVTTIPAPPLVDKIWFEEKNEKDSSGILHLEFTDPPDQKNYYRTFTKIRGKDVNYSPMYFSVFSDVSFSGKQFGFSIYKGGSTISDLHNDIYFTRGDSVFIKFCSIDEASFNFWHIAEHDIYSAVNPFISSGVDIKSNISNGALGIWGGYGAVYYLFVINVKESINNKLL